MTWENYEHDVFAAEREAYPREQYEADRAKAIAEGVNPRLIMGYSECLAYMAWEAEKDREFDTCEAYDNEWDEDDVRQMREAYAELEREKAAERESIAFFEQQLAEWDAEMEAEEVEDATEWEKFPEYERVLYALAELKTSRS